MTDTPTPSSNAEESKLLRAELPGITESTDRKKGRWFRRLRTLALLVLFLIVASRAIVVVLFPVVLQRVAGYYGLTCAYERLELSVLSGDTGLWHLVIKPKDSNEPLAVIEYCRGDISSLNLLRGRLAVWRVEADGVNLAIDRNADGSMPLLKLLASNTTDATHPTPAAAATTQPGKPINFAPPLRLDALRLTHIKLHVRDKSVTPAFDSVVSVDLRLSDLGGESGRPTRFSADVDADPFLDALHVTGDGKVDHGTIDANFKADVNGLRLRPLAPYLAAIGVRPLANETTIRAGGEIKVGPSLANANIVAATLKFHDVALTADGEEAAGVDQLTVDAPSLEITRVGLKAISLRNVRLNGRRAADGSVRFAGLEYIGIPAGVAATTRPQTPASTPLTLPVIDLPILSVVNLAAHFHDDAIAPPVDVALKFDDVAIKNIVLDPAHPDTAINLTGTAQSPGIAQAIHFDGSMKPMTPTKSFVFKTSADDVELAAIKPYLDLIGITSTLHDATFAASMNVDVTPTNDHLLINTSIEKIKLTQGTDLITMDHVTINGADIGASPPSIVVKDVSIAGPAVGVSREADGTIAAAGFRFDPKILTRRASQPIPLRSTQSASTVAMSASRPLIPVVKHLHWDGIDVTYDDRVLSPPIHTRVEEASIDLNGSTLAVRARVPKIVEHLQIDGSANSSGDEHTGKLKVTAGGINATIVAPFLQPFHIEPTLQDGAINATANVTVRPRGDAFDGALAITDVVYRDGDRELAGVDKVTVNGISASLKSLSIDAIHVTNPRAVITHEKNGPIAAAGFRVLPAAFASLDSQPTTSPTSATFPVATTRAGVSPFTFSLNTFQLDHGSLRIIDETRSTDLTASATLGMTRVTAQPAQLSLQANIPGVVDEATMTGTLDLGANNASTNLAISAKGMRAGTLAAYLPPAVTVPLKSGNFRTSLRASIGIANVSGVKGTLSINNLDFRESNEKTPLAKVDSFRVIASRIDPAAGIFALDELSSDGVELSAARTATGGARALGVAFDPAAPSAVAVPENPPAATTRPVASIASMVAGARKTLPVIQLNRLNLNARRITLVDEQRPTAAPVVVSDLRFRSLDPIDWGGADPDAHPPTHFRLDCTLDPAVGLVTVTATAAPLATQPTLTLDVLASGIRGDGITALLPEAKSMIRGSELVDGNFRLHLDTSLRLTRRGETTVDLNGPVDADIDIKPIQFRGTQGGPILAGVDELQSEGVHFEPKSGGLHVKTVEITKPIGHFSREKDGFHLLGVVFTPPVDATPNGAPTGPSTAPIAKPLANPATAPAARPARPSAEVRVDQLVVNDLDVVVENRTVEPAFVVPLTALDLEVRDFTNMAPYEDRPLKFSALVNAGKVPLPAKKDSRNNAATEERELFAQASANGSIGLYPAPNGYIKTSLGGFELGSLASEAAQYKVKLSDGVFDSTVDAKLPGDGSIATKARFVFTDLVLSEPPNGPIARFLHLGAPLDVVVGALQDPDGSITIPLDFPVKNGALSPAALAGPAVGAFASIAATAVASAPLKAASAVGDLLGIGGKKIQAPEPPVSLQFEAGDVTLSAEDLATIAALKIRLTKDDSLNLVIKHVLGGGDLMRAETRSNPTTQEAEALAQQLREQQLASAQSRSQLAGIARSEIERGAATSDSLARVKLLDQQMAQTDDAMDRLFEMLRPGADRMAARRSRATCLEYGKARLAAIQSALLDRLPAGVADRIHLLTPQYSQPTDDAGGTVIVEIISRKK